ncbi:hypothetical protein AgCh_029796 [Apium graveolens]
MPFRNRLSILIISLLFSVSSADDTAVMIKLSAALSSLSDWTGTSYCEWSGVNCDHCDRLRNNRLTGVLPPLTKLPKLINISLQYNKLQGQFPEFKSGVKARFEQTISFCRSSPGPCDSQVNVLLAVAGAFGVELNMQNFSGRISPALANLTSLRHLLLSNNDLTGSIPEGLKSLDQLVVLDVSYNNLSGSVPNFTPTVKFTAIGNLFFWAYINSIATTCKL